MRVGAALYEEYAYAPGRQLSRRHFRRLSGADHDGSADADDPAHRDAVAVHAARRQRRRRRQLHEHAGLHRQCGRRCARRRRDRSAADAGEARRAICTAPRSEQRAASGAMPRRQAKGARAARRAARRAVGGRAGGGVGACCSTRNAGSDHSRLPSVEKISDTHFRADVTLGVGPVKGRYQAPTSSCPISTRRKRGDALRLVRPARSAMGTAQGRVTLAATEDGGTRVSLRL